MEAIFDDYFRTYVPIPNAILANSDDLFGITVISSICADNGKQCATKRY